MIQKYTQTTYETCLACCLLQAVDHVKPIKITQKLELQCINHSMKFNRDDFVVGHLDFISKISNVKIKRIVDNKLFYGYMAKIKTSPKIKTDVRKIDLELVDSLLDKRPIVYIDAYTLFGVYHVPHFVTILGKIGNRYTLFDTWDGKEKLIDCTVLAQGISFLRNHIKMCPQVLIVE